MAVLSAGLLLFRPDAADGVEVMLGHMGGPYWARKDDGAWSVPKGEHGPDEDPRTAAEREFTEELGSPPPPGPQVGLGTVRQRAGKLITVFARQADFDADNITPGVFELEWPPRSGALREFPEIDRAGWFDLPSARAKILEGQRPFLDRLAGLVTQFGTRPAP